MMTFVVRPLIASVFDRIGARDVDRVVAGLATDVHHRFAGTHASAVNETTGTPSAPGSNGCSACTRN